jgi:hypothetical protein
MANQWNPATPTLSTPPGGGAIDGIGETLMPNSRESAVSTVSMETTAEMLNGSGTAAQPSSEAVQTPIIKPWRTIPGLTGSSMSCLAW